MTKRPNQPDDHDEPPVQLTDEDMVTVTGQMAEVMRTGLPLSSGLAALAEEEENRRIRASLMYLSRRLSAGEELPGVLSRMNAAPDLVALMRAGQHSGRTDEVLLSYVEHVEKVKQHRQRLRIALLYPLFLVVWALFGFIAYAFLIPQELWIFDDFGMELSWFSRTVLETADYVHRNFVLISVVTVAVILAGWFCLEFLFSATARRRILLAVPVIGRILRLSALSRFTRMLSVLLRHRVSLPAAISRAGEACRDPLLTRAADALAGHLESGRPADELQGVDRVFSPTLLELFSVVGTDAALGETLEAMCSAYETRLQTRIASLQIVARPVVIILTGLFIAGLMFALLHPLLSLLNDLG